jgi:hypothetical protein
MFATLLATAATQNAITILEKPFVVQQRREVLKKLTIFSFTNKSQNVTKTITQRRRRRRRHLL